MDEDNNTSLAAWRLASSSLDNQPDSLLLHRSTSLDDLSLGLNLNSDLTIPPTMGKSKRSLSLRTHRSKSFFHCYHGLVTDGPGGKKLKRKNGASNLNQTPASSVSVTSSPPPLSPSYSMSVMSQRSEQDPDREGLLCMYTTDGMVYQMGADRTVSRTSSPDYAIQKRPSRLNTSRDRMKKPSITSQPSFPGHNKARSDSLLVDFNRSKATMVHQGTAFEILNPHESLNFARIVSYIEDVDYSPRASSDRRPDSFLSGSSMNSMVLKQEADVPVPPLPDSYSSAQDTSDGDGKAHSDLVGDVAHSPMPSISERLVGSRQDSYGSRPETQRSDPSDLGEPGPCEESSLHRGDHWTTSDSNAWPLRENQVQPAHESRTQDHRPVSTQQADKRKRFSRLRKMVRSVGFMRRRSWK